MTIGFTLRWNDTTGAGGALLIPRENQKKVTKLPMPLDEEAHGSKNESHSNETAGATIGSRGDAALVRNTSVFTWRNLSYVVKISTGDRTLLDNVHGYCKPGMLGALMGASGK
jgi:hypothetical protein